MAKKKLFRNKCVSISVVKITRIMFINRPLIDTFKRKEKMNK